MPLKLLLSMIKNVFETLFYLFKLFAGISFIKELNYWILHYLIHLHVHVSIQQKVGGLHSVYNLGALVNGIVTLKPASFTCKSTFTEWI